MADPIAVYVHTPFCPSKCGYCDFNSYAMDGPIIERTVQAIESEIRSSPHAGQPAKTVFFGGGTPTFLSADQITRLLRAVLDTHPVSPTTEVTSEGNPGTVDIPKFAAMRAAGFNRISLGAQSFDTSDLIRLGRVHAPNHIGRAVAAAREAGFDNLNLDLMFALPGQSLRAWQNNLDLAVSLEPEHLSLYCLTIEPNTRYYRHQARGLLNLPSDDLQVAMYDAAVASCTDAGFHQYEISNFSRPGRESQHNLCYWHGEPYLGYGPGAVGCTQTTPDTRTRYTNFKHPLGYCERIENRQPLWCDSEELTLEDIRLERIMLGLRLNRGLHIAGLTLDPRAIQDLERRGWLSATPETVTLTPEGRHFCSEVAARLA